LQSCITSSKEDKIEFSLAQLRSQVSQLKELLNQRNQQITNTTQSLVNSQQDLQGLQAQLQLTEGALDELKIKVNRIEENSGNQRSSEENLNTLNNKNFDKINLLERQIARIELLSNTKTALAKKGKLPQKIKTAESLKKTLKKLYEQNHFKQAIELSNSVLSATDTSPDLTKIALEYRAESKFKLQDFQGSAIDYSTYTENYPQSPKYPRALLLAGDSYVYLKNNNIAKSYYQECAITYSQLPEGKAASSRLKNLMTKMSSSRN
jgi:TolA-binding protein